MKIVTVLAFAIALLPACATVPTTPPGSVADSKDMRLVGHEPLQARSAYQPLVVKQGDRWIAYVGHHGGNRMNPLTGRMELNGTSIVDVTDPARPQYLHHIPGAPGEAEAGGASMVRQGWRTNRMTKIYDLSDPANPRLIRDFGLTGQEPDSTSTTKAPEGVHGPIALRNRVYFAYGTGANGVLQIVDRDRLLNGNPASADRFAPTSLYYGKLVFLAYFNAGVRAVDIRNPFAPREVAYFIPAVSAATDKRCIKIDGADQCKVAIQTNNVEVDDRGLIYLADRASTGLHIVALTGAAKAIVE
jgi:hypothetical protein